MKSIATQINDAVLEANENVVLPDYNGDPNDSDDRANKYTWQQYIDRIDNCVGLLAQAIDLCSGDDDDVQRYANSICFYENMIYFQECAIDSCSWDYYFDTWGNKFWKKEWMLSDEAKIARKKLINQYRERISAMKAEKALKEKENARKRFAEYWEKHADEKKKLETEKQSLEKLITVLYEEIKNIPEKSKIREMEVKIQSLDDEKRALGLFKTRERKIIQEQIDSATAELKTTSNKAEIIEGGIKRKIASAQKRINNIVVELTKKR